STKTKASAWTCPACTLINQTENAVCSACDAPKSSGSATSAVAHPGRQASLASADVQREAELRARERVDELRALCRSAGEVFVDDEFPPGDRALYGLGGRHRRRVAEEDQPDGGQLPCGIRWCRLEEIQHEDLPAWRSQPCQFPQLRSPAKLNLVDEMMNFFTGRTNGAAMSQEADRPEAGPVTHGTGWIVVDERATASAADIRQGYLGDCWLLSALAVVAERRSMLRRILLTREVNPEGVYAVQLCVAGLWKTVYIDGFFPCRADTRTLVYSHCRGAQLWVALVEKALAKEFGSYAALTSGRSLEGLAILTGAPCESYELQSDAVQSNQEERELIWAKLLSGAERGCLIGASCGAGRMTLPDEAYQALGLYPRHAYSVLQVRSAGPHQLLLLRNPWGRGEWRGRFSPGHRASWAELEPQYRQELTDVLSSGDHQQDSGLFWIGFDDLLAYFDSVDIAHCPLNESEVHEVRLSCLLKPKEPLEVFAMTVLERTALDLVLYQPCNRYSDSIVLGDLCLVVCQGDNDLRPGRIIHQTQRYVRNFIMLSAVLDPGVYTVACLSFNKWTLDKPVKLNLAVHSSQQPVLLEQMQCGSQHWLAELVCKLAEKCAPRCQLRPGVDSYYLTTGWAGLICVVVNRDPRQCMLVKCECNGSENVVSTRGAIESTDIIPPLHRQVVMLLSQLESSERYSVHHRIVHQPLHPHHISRMQMHVPPLTDEVSCLHAVLPLD
ncbi:hypothetical protein BOX15_Mlig004275g1, partial [Macrostomum lignano]